MEAELTGGDGGKKGGRPRNGAGHPPQPAAAGRHRHGGHGAAALYHYQCQALPALLPLPLPPPLLVYLPAVPLPPAKAHHYRSPIPAAAAAALLPLPQGVRHDRASNLIPGKRRAVAGTNHLETDRGPVTVARRPDSGGTDGCTVPLLANHFLVQFDPLQLIFHYDVKIIPWPSKETARLIKRKLVEDNAELLNGSMLAFDGWKNLYSPILLRDDKLELSVHVPVHSKSSLPPENCTGAKLFRVSIRLVSKLSAEDLNKYLTSGDERAPLPQDYVQALDVVLRESPAENCIPSGRSFYTSLLGGARDVGGGVVGMRGFFQSLRPTRQGLALNVDLSVMAFHESIPVIPYLQKRCEFSRDAAADWKARGLTEEERRSVEKVLKDIRVFVCHRYSGQRYRIYSLTAEATESLKFRDRSSGKELAVVDYFREQYSHEIQFKKLPCLQISRSKPCFLPMELCAVCDAQKFIGKLSDEQAAKILKLGCQRPAERRQFIKGVVDGAFGPRSGSYADEFGLRVSRDMTRLSGRVLQPPKLKLGDGGVVKEITPDRHDRQWNLANCHVAEGSRIRRWALISFGGTAEQHGFIPKFMKQLVGCCGQLGILLNKSTVIGPVFEKMQMLGNAGSLEAKLRRIHELSAGSLQLLVCVMERRHSGYADLKRIAETGIGVVTQCCLYSNLGKLTSQFLGNLALKINAKIGGANVALSGSLPSQVPRIFTYPEPAIFMGADVTHPHPLDDVSPSVAGVVGSMNWPEANKYMSRMRSQTHRKEIIEHLDAMVGELIDEFVQETGKLPGRIIFFRDGVSETQFDRVLAEELRAIRRGCDAFPGYAPAVTFIVVQKRHHTRLFLHSGEQNVPAGTVVDTAVTHPKGFDFFLCSHWSAKGTSRPAHYCVLWDDSRFSSDELQRLVHGLCYTFARCAGPVSLVPPAYYAHLAAYRGRMYLERPDRGGEAAMSRTAAATPIAPLPEIQQSVKRLMFYC